MIIIESAKIMFYCSGEPCSPIVLVAKLKLPAAASDVLHYSFVQMLFMEANKNDADKSGS